MIRTYQNTDRADVVAMVMAGKHMKPDEISERMQQGPAWVYDDGKIGGCAVMSAARKSQLGARVDLWLFTAPGSRSKGIGSQLWAAVWPEVLQQQPKVAVTGYRSDLTNAPRFFAARGFQKWSASHLMAYEGPDFTIPAMDLLPYSEVYFGDYIRLINSAFYQLRQENDVKPYEVYPEGGFDEAATRQELEQERERIFLLRQDDRIVALARMGTDYIDEVAVDPAYQRRGYGRALTQFCINHLRQQGVQRVLLGVVDSNAAAINLYQSLGFTLCETHEFARCFLD